MCMCIVWIVHSRPFTINQYTVQYKLSYSPLTRLQFTILFTWMLGFAGGVLYDASVAVYQGTSPLADWNIMLAGSLLLVIFGVSI